LGEESDKGLSLVQVLVNESKPDPFYPESRISNVKKSENKTLTTKNARNHKRTSSQVM